MNPYTEGKLLLIDKPAGISSFGVIKHIRDRIKDKYGIKKIKVGHAGTLDPLATGLLIVCTGKMTKRIHEYQGLPKTYSGIIRLGATTPSYDLETDIDKTYPFEHITGKMVKDAAREMTGEILQRPPIYSAIKKKGERMYEKARRGEKTELPPRKVHIHSFDITRIQLPDVYFRIECSKGTYIRSVAFDFGEKLHSGAHLAQLRRDAIGQYHVSDAIGLYDFEP